MLKKPMNIAILCEYSGIVRDAFIKKGHNAISCDILPSERPGPHFQGDALLFLQGEWDMIISHPPCTYLTCSAEWAYKEGPYHQKVKPETLVGSARVAAREEALIFVDAIFKAKAKKKVIENPRGVISTRIKPATQYIQPNEFGEDASKITGLWIEGLPDLVPTKKVRGRFVEYPKGSGKIVERWSNQTDSGQNKLPPSTDRGKLRSKFYQGWADAMADQWG